MVGSVIDDDDVKREKEREYNKRYFLKKKILELAKTAEFGKEYEVDGIFISFTMPEGED